MNDRSSTLELRRSLVQRMHTLGIRIEVPDRNTVLLRNVPLNAHHYSKERTNLLVKRPGPGKPFLACIDEDVKYSGDDPDLSRCVASGLMREGWRVLPVEPRVSLELDSTVEYALSLLGSEGGDPALRMPSREYGHEEDGLLRRFGTNLTESVKKGDAPVTVGRVEEVINAAACTSSWGPGCLGLIVGEPGVGKSNLLYGIARKLHECRPDRELIMIDLGRLFSGTFLDSERENLLQAVLDQAGEAKNVVLATEQLDLLSFNPRSSLEHLLTAALDRGLTLLGTLLPEHLSAFRRPRLDGRTHVILLDEPAESATVEILKALQPAIAEHHGVTIDDVCLRLCVSATRSLPGRYPAKAIRALNHAAARAALLGVACVGAEDVGVG